MRTTKNAKSSTRKPRKAAEKRTRVPLGHDIPETAKIKVVGDNPRHKGSGPWKQYELMRKVRTVAQFVEKGGSRRWLPGAVKRKFIASLGR